MKELLMRAGAPPSALTMIKTIVDTCRVCRMWTRPGPKSMQATRLATGFNELVQWDILFIDDVMVSHCIDEATRWSAGDILSSKSAIKIIESLTKTWLRPYGPMKVLTTDQEAGLTGEEAAQWCDRWAIQIKTREPGSHAQMVERHHEMLRRLVHRVQVQLREERIKIPMDIIVAECFLIKNLMTSVGGSSPYQAVFGRVPPILSEFEPASETQIDDLSAGIPGISRHHHRLREVTVEGMVDLTAKQRMERALNSKTRLAHEQLALQQGDQVDFHREPSTKDESGWRGPATVVQIGPPAVIKWQGKFVQARTQDLRRALVCLAFLIDEWYINTSYYREERTQHWYKVQPESPVHRVQAFAETMDKRVVRLGWVFDSEWTRAEANRRQSELLWTILHLASCGFHLTGCVGARIGCGIAVLEGVIQCDNSFLWWWNRGDARNQWYYESHAGIRLRLTEIFGKDKWSETAFVQFLMTSDQDVQSIRRQEPTIPHIGGPHVPDVHPRRPPQPPHPPPGLPPQPPPQPPSQPPLLPPPSQPPNTPHRPSSERSRSTPGRSPGDSDRRPPSVESPRSRSTRGRPSSEPRTPSTISSWKPASERSPYGSTRSRTTPSAKEWSPPVTPTKADRSSSTSNKRPNDEDGGSATPRPPKWTRADKHPAPETSATGASSSSAGAAPSHPEPVLPLADDDSDDSDQTQDYPENMLIIGRSKETAAGGPTDAFMNLIQSPEIQEEEGWNGMNPRPSQAAYATAESASKQQNVDDDAVEFAIPNYMTQFVIPDQRKKSRRARHKTRDIYVVKFYADDRAPHVVVEREMNTLTLEEARKHETDVRKAIYDELQRWNSLGGFVRYERSKARNILDSRWVLKWKMVDGKRIIKARLTARGFRDAQAQEVSTYAGTATRWSQRLVNMMCAQKRWTLFSADISQAFLRGLTFEQIEQMEGEIHREVQMTLPPGSVQVLRQIEGYEDFNEVTEVLRMLRGGFGLKDAPRLWQKMLQMVLERTGVVSLTIEAKLYVLRKDGQIRLVMSSHVDDLKGGGDDETRTLILTCLEKEFGKLKVQYGTFECIGIMHEQDKDTKEIWTHQRHYIPQLKAIPEEAYCTAKPEDLVSEVTHASFRSLLGGIAWLTLTMLPICIYVASLQRKSQGPTVKDIKECNRLLRWIRLHAKEMGIRFIHLPEPCRLVVVSDSAFKAEEYAGLAMRGCIIMMVSASVDLPTTQAWSCVVLDWFARKHTHVVRSTFAAELHALLDAVGQAMLINLVITEMFGPGDSPHHLAKLQDNGKLWPALEAFIDARAVFDALAAEPVRIPTEKNLYIHLLAAKDLLQKKILRRLTWIDTLDMLADGMTKGVIDRAPLLAIGNKGQWKLSGQAPVSTPDRAL